MIIMIAGMDFSLNFDVIITEEGTVEETAQVSFDTRYMVVTLHCACTCDVQLLLVGIWRVLFQLPYLIFVCPDFRRRD